MSIDSTKPVPTISGTLNRDLINAQKNQSKPIQTTNNSVASTNVSLSQTASTLLSSTQYDINMAKVEKIKQAIEDGTLVIDTHKIADELINQTIQHIAAEIEIEGK